MFYNCRTGSSWYGSEKIQITPELWPQKPEGFSLMRRMFTISSIGSNGPGWYPQLRLSLPNPLTKRPDLKRSGKSKGGGLEVLVSEKSNLLCQENELFLNLSWQSLDYHTATVFFPSLLNIILAHSITINMDSLKIVKWVITFSFLLG